MIDSPDFIGVINKIAKPFIWAALVHFLKLLLKFRKKFKLKMGKCFNCLCIFMENNTISYYNYS